MTTRGMVRIVGSLITAFVLASCAPPEPRPDVTGNDEAAVRQALVDCYAAWSGTDEAYYRTFLTDDYVLLEHGELMDVEDDVRMMRERPSGYARTDAFDFLSVVVHDDFAYATFFLDSEMVDDTQTRQGRWLESAVLRRGDGRWRIALLHSTRLSITETAP